MNLKCKERLLELADKLEKLPFELEDDDHSVESFTMTQYVKSGTQNVNCGTACCIAGWALALYEPNISLGDGNVEYGFRYVERAAKCLGLDLETAQVLFYAADGRGMQKSLISISPQEAARACRNVADGARTFMFIWES